MTVPEFAKLFSVPEEHSEEQSGGGGGKEDDGDGKMDDEDWAQQTKTWDCAQCGQQNPAHATSCEWCAVRVVGPARGAPRQVGLRILLLLQPQDPVLLRHLQHREAGPLDDSLLRMKKEGGSEREEEARKTGKSQSTMQSTVNRQQHGAIKREERKQTE